MFFSSSKLQLFKFLIHIYIFRYLGEFAILLIKAYACTS